MINLISKLFCIKVSFPTKEESKLLKLINIDYSHRESREKKSILDTSYLTPWFTYPAIEYLEELNFTSKKVLEWGGGASTFFWRSKSALVNTIEGSSEWRDLLISKGVDPNFIYVAQSRDEYTNNKFTNGEYDVIVIDGSYRDDCVSKCLSLVSGNGIIILDNSERHPDLCEIIRNNNFIQVDFHGIGPINSYPWTTTIFLSRRVELLPSSRMPVMPRGAL